MARARGVRQKQAAPLGYDRLRRVLDGLGDRPADLRDAAHLALAYDTLARRSELVAFGLTNIGRDPDRADPPLEDRPGGRGPGRHQLGAAVPAAWQRPQGRPARRG